MTPFARLRQTAWLCLLVPTLSWAEPLTEAEALDLQASELYSQGQYAEAEIAARESLEIRRTAQGEDHPEFASSLSNLARLLRAQGGAAAARPLFEQSLAIQEHALGPDDPKLAIGTAALADLLWEAGELDGAQALFERSLAIQRAAHDENHPKVATALSNLGQVLVERGAWAEARRLLEEGLAIRTNALGPDHPRVAASLATLAALLTQQGDYAAARLLMERSMIIRRGALGEDHARVARGLGTLGVLLKTQGDFAAARPVLEESLTISREVLKEGHPGVAAALDNLASLSSLEGDAETARSLYQESLTIQLALNDEDHAAVIASRNNLASQLVSLENPDGARDLQERNLTALRRTHGEEHPDVAEGLHRLAGLLAGQGSYGAASPLLEQALAIRREALGDDHPKVASTLNLLAWTLEDVAAARPLRSEALRIWEHNLSRRDAVSEREVLSLLPAARNTLDAWLSAFANSDHDGEAWTHVLRFKGVDEATPSEICAALPEGAAIVDFLRYRKGGQANYVAFSVNTEDCGVRRTELGLASPLDDAIVAWREVLANPQAAATEVDARGSEVLKVLWTPLAPAVGDATHLFVVPDGAIASAPLAALPIRDAQYLLEDLAITWLDRSNDLLLPQTSRGVGALVVGEVDHEAAAGDSGTRGLLAPCNDAEFSPLTNKTTELEALANRWGKTRKDEPLTRMMGGEATEAAVGEALPGKAIVHLATHGFFATGRCRSALEGDGKVGFDPMVLSGLALAGANRAPDPLSSDDGVLTAAEIAALDLSDTGLVVLSACDTALGEIRSGEGVLGLRRAFHAAGVGTVITTLWSGGDEGSLALIEDLYAIHLRRRPVAAADAVRKAQLDMLKRQRSDDAVQLRDWAGFIASGDWR